MANFESSDDLTNFFITDDFAVSATYTVQGGSASTIKGVFDKEFIELLKRMINLDSIHPK